MTDQPHIDSTRGAKTFERRMTLRLPDDAWKILDALAPSGDRCALIAYFLRCEAKRQGAFDMSAPRPPPSLLAFQRSVARSGSPTKQPGKLRWSAEVYEGKPFVSARIWTLGSNGDEYPTEKGITIRASEIDQVIDALCKVRDRMRKTGSAT